jgi:hypothetical protein
MKNLQVKQIVLGGSVKLYLNENDIKVEDSENFISKIGKSDIMGQCILHVIDNLIGVIKRYSSVQ